MSAKVNSKNLSLMLRSYCAAGPNTKMYMYEAAAIYLAWVTSGAPCVNQPHPAKAVKVDGITPVEARFCVEVGKAASQLNRDVANDLVIRLLQKYEADITNAPEGDCYHECHEAETGKPNDGYLKLVDEVTEELFAMGIPMA